MRTEHTASAATFCETLPRKRRSRVERPCEPNITRSAFQFVALVRIPQPGESAHAADSIFHFENSVFRRSAARAARALALSTAASALSRALRTAWDAAAGN